MTRQRLKNYMAELDSHIDKQMGSKGAEYHTENDSLHNFKLSAELQLSNIGETINGFMVKHTTSIIDLLDRLDCQKYGDSVYQRAVNTSRVVKYMESGLKPSKSVLLEKFGDDILYMKILYGYLRSLEDETI